MPRKSVKPDNNEVSGAEIDEYYDKTNKKINNLENKLLNKLKAIDNQAKNFEQSIRNSDVKTTSLKDTIEKILKHLEKEGDRTLTNEIKTINEVHKMPKVEVQHIDVDEIKKYTDDRINE